MTYVKAYVSAYFFLKLVYAKFTSANFQAHIIIILTFLLLLDTQGRSSKDSHCWKDIQPQITKFALNNDLILPYVNTYSTLLRSWCTGKVRKNTWEKKWLVYKSGLLWKLEFVLLYTLSDTKSLRALGFVRWQVHCQCSNN